MTMNQGAKSLGRMDDRFLEYGEHGKHFSDTPRAVVDRHAGRRSGGCYRERKRNISHCHHLTPSESNA